MLWGVSPKDLLWSNLGKQVFRQVNTSCKYHYNPFIFSVAVWKIFIKAFITVLVCLFLHMSMPDNP